MSRTRAMFAIAAAMLTVVGCSRPVAPLPEAPVPSPTPAPPVVFPRDAGPHDGLTEWWYYTGHLHTSDGHEYGFEFVIFQTRRQNAPSGYLSHFAISDIDAGWFSHQLRFAQSDTPGAVPLNVNGWRLSSDGAADSIEARMERGPGADEAYTLRLTLKDEKPPALHHGGYIEYGAPGGSYYYSRTRLSVSGELGVGDAASSHVDGIAWMDHQWGNFIVTPAGGWDWYSLQLDDGTELMLYVLRSLRSETEPTGTYGTYVLADGSVLELSGSDIRASATGSWTSPHTGAVYPSGWQVILASGERLTIEPRLKDQELWFPQINSEASVTAGAGAMAYWEGAVSVSGDRSGVGYVELTGYARR